MRSTLTTGPKFRDNLSRRDAEMAIFEYINGLYNPRPKHSALGWKSPLAFEAKAA
jgi:transposase InsO family protein